MTESTEAIRTAAATVIAEIDRRRSVRGRPLVVALDGPSGSGKSTLVAQVARELDTAVIATDDFYAFETTDDQWNARTPEERARDCIDWHRLRDEALVPLIAGLPARWQTYDFEAGGRSDGTYAARANFVELDPAPVIVLDGVYSARPELADVIDLMILVDAPREVRRQRLASREAREHLERWYARWGAAETFYFAHVRPEDAFDLVIGTQ